MKKVFVASPSGGPDDLRRAQVLCRRVADLEGEWAVPYSPQVAYAEVLDPGRQEEREVAVVFALRELSRCDEVVIYVVDGVVADRNPHPGLFGKPDSTRRERSILSVETSRILLETGLRGRLQAP